MKLVKFYPIACILRFSLCTATIGSVFENLFEKVEVSLICIALLKVLGYGTC